MVSFKRKKVCLVSVHFQLCRGSSTAKGVGGEK